MAEQGQSQSQTQSQSPQRHETKNETKDEHTQLLPLPSPPATASTTIRFKALPTVGNEHVRMYMGDINMAYDIKFPDALPFPLPFDQNSFGAPATFSYADGQALRVVNGKPMLEKDHVFVEFRPPLGYIEVRASASASENKVRPHPVLRLPYYPRDTIRRLESRMQEARACDLLRTEQPCLRVTFPSFGDARFDEAVVRVAQSASSAAFAITVPAALTEEQTETLRAKVEQHRSRVAKVYHEEQVEQGTKELLANSPGGAIALHHLMTAFDLGLSLSSAMDIAA
jgi:hypothetical protein